MQQLLGKIGTVIVPIAPRRKGRITIEGETEEFIATAHTYGEMFSKGMQVKVMKCDSSGILFVAQSKKIERR
jgi:hypothetical protein